MNAVKESTSGNACNKEGPTDTGSAFHEIHYTAQYGDIY
jgi:hypothetical protein